MTFLTQASWNPGVAALTRARKPGRFSDLGTKSLEGIVASFGVTYLSKEALRDARRFMHADQAGVRDEVGFLIIHQRYADRFFPGTSVLHTRLRYVLFIPWIYADARNSRLRQRDPADVIARGEHKLTERLLGQDGVIVDRRTGSVPIGAVTH